MIRKKITFAHACTTTVTDVDAIGHVIEFESLEGNKLLWNFHTFGIRYDIIIKKKEREREREIIIQAEQTFCGRATASNT
mmetsp:Transcript_33086/g.69485  ORF Transcript_33086/g.69485 Transcript_33086/m.69485 type:complete len:80 (-) Transcript_33086:710-949(-)